MRRVLLTHAASLAEAGGTVRDTLVDSNRLRRMDRFGRSGFLAGARVLAAAGRPPAAVSGLPDPRFGVVVGTALGCRDAITQHERLLASAGRAEDLAPSVFVATVHNAVCGEIAILYGLGGVAETLSPAARPGSRPSSSRRAASPRATPTASSSSRRRGSTRRRAARSFARTRGERSSSRRRRCSSRRKKREKKRKRSL